MSNFITIGLAGRLGNQLYQHSAAIALALKNRAEYLAYPKSDTADEPNYFKGLFPEWQPSNGIEFEYTEPSHAYTPIEFRPNMRLTGYFQSHKYWWDIQDKVLPLFKINPIVKKDTVAIHWRLGDFLVLQQKHNLITEGYIQRAVQYYNNRGFSKFLVASDNIELCKPIFQSEYFKESTFEFSEGKTALEDMALLAGCAHQIGSASTFSYWNFYLNPNPNKTCILPDNLWGSSHQNVPQGDSHPPNCIRFKN